MGMENDLGRTMLVGKGGSRPQTNSLKNPLKNARWCQQQQWQTWQKNWDAQPHCARLPEEEGMLEQRGPTPESPKPDSPVTYRTELILP